MKTFNLKDERLLNVVEVTTIRRAIEQWIRHCQPLLQSIPLPDNMKSMQRINTLRTQAKADIETSKNLLALVDARGSMFAFLLGEFDPRFDTSEMSLSDVRAKAAADGMAEYMSWQVQPHKARSDLSRGNLPQGKWAPWDGRAEPY